MEKTESGLLSRDVKKSRNNAVSGLLSYKNKRDSKMLVVIGEKACFAPVFKVGKMPASARIHGSKTGTRKLHEGLKEWMILVWDSLWEVKS